MAPVVLMVAEKPSIAKSIADILGHGKAHTRKQGQGYQATHDFEGPFLKHPKAFYKVTSVAGHVYRYDFCNQIHHCHLISVFCMML